MVGCWRARKARCLHAGEQNLARLDETGRAQTGHAWSQRPGVAAAVRGAVLAV